MSTNSFSRAERIRARRDFVRLSESSRKIVSKRLILQAEVSQTVNRRIGITVSRKVGNAVTRNRLKRMIRECYRNNKAEFPVADFVVIVRSGAERITYQELCQELLNATHRIGRQLNG